LKIYFQIVEAFHVHFLPLFSTCKVLISVTKSRDMAAKYIIRKRQNTILYTEFFLAALATGHPIIICLRHNKTDAPQNQYL